MVPENLCKITHHDPIKHWVTEASNNFSQLSQPIILPCMNDLAWVLLPCNSQKEDLSFNFAVKAYKKIPHLCIGWQVRCPKPRYIKHS